MALGGGGGEGGGAPQALLLGVLGVLLLEVFVVLLEVLGALGCAAVLWTMGGGPHLPWQCRQCFDQQQQELCSHP